MATLCASSGKVDTEQPGVGCRASTGLWEARHPDQSNCVWDGRRKPATKFASRSLSPIIPVVGQRRQSKTGGELLKATQGCYIHRDIRWVAHEHSSGYRV